MPTRLTATITYPRDPNLYIRDHLKFLRGALHDGAEFHHEKHIPRHFEPFAAAKYGYAKRIGRLKLTPEAAKRRGLSAPTYQALKDKLGLPPLVSPTDHSGATRDKITRERKIQATPKGATLIMRLPFKGGTGRFRLKAGQTSLTSQQKVVLQIHEEIKAISPDEIRTLGRRIREQYLKNANDPNTKHYKRERYGPA